ncbi:MAG: hypothetical protein DMF61_19875 [Blastocatellia bacterium AA13]|nr:MAG: hypothetical protein DMF61_19875 [Blastocatellia bacterium AA13]
MRHFKKRLSYAAALFLISASVLPVFRATTFAQSSKGVLVGTVKDPTGAVVAGATVKVTNSATGVSRETATTDGGYRLEALDPGTYRLDVMADGFKKAARENIVVEAAQTGTIDFALEVGAQSEVVNIVGEGAVTLQKQDGARTNTLEQRQIVDLPIAGLNPVGLVFTLPGVTNPGVLAGGFVQGTEFNINGLRARSNNQLIDGTDNNDNSITGQQLQPVLRDGFREVAVLGGDNSAEYGRAGGAVINVVTRSGSNQYHGSVYDVIDTSALASLSPGQKVNQGLVSVPVYTQNSFGFSFGGPIKKDKLFFFGTFQPTLTRSSVNTSAVIPTDAGFNTLRSLFHQGASANVDRYLGVLGSLRGATNPFNVPLGGGRPDVQFGTVTTSQSQPVNTYDTLVRVDWTPNARDSYAARYIRNDQTFTNQFPTAFDGFAVDVNAAVQNFFGSYTRVLSNRWVNEFRFSYGKFDLLFGARDQAAIAFGPEFLFSGIPISGVGQIGGISSTFPQGRNFNNYQFQDTATYTRGTHTIRAGADLVKQIASQIVPFNGQGTLTFSSGGGSPTFGNFVDGFSGTQGTFAAKVFGSAVTHPDAFQQAYFVNDTWRVKQNLTLTLGLRYENYGTPFNVVPFPAFAGFDVPIDAKVDQQRDNNNFAPRLSFAYTPRIWKRLFGEDKTVIRAGYGMSYDVFFNNVLSNTAASSPNVVGVNTFGSAAGGRGFANAGVNSLPVTAPPPDPFVSITTVLPNFVNPLIHTWNFGIQRELPWGVLLDTAYVGTRAERLPINEQLNPGIDEVRIHPTRGSVVARTNGGDSIYHSLQTRVERGMKNGLMFRFAYTYSKAIDDVNSEVFVTTGGASRASNPFDRRIDRSVASFDVPHRFAWTFIYDLPGPKKGLIGGVIGDWRLSGVYRIQSGNVETPFVGGLDLNGDTESFNDRPAIGNPNAPANSVAILGDIFGIPSPTGYIDANGNPVDPANARFIVDPNRRTGLAGRNILRGNRFNQMDLSLNKAFKLPFEGQRLEVRFDVFNVFNHANYTWGILTSDNSNGDVLNPFFNNVKLNDGGIAGPTGNPVGRYGRFQVRYSF